MLILSLHTLFVSFSIHPAQAAENPEPAKKARATKEQREETRRVLKNRYDQSEGFLRACATLLLKTARTEDRVQALINLCKLLKENPYMNLQTLFTLLEGTDTDTLKRIFSKLSE
jgi:hypothetical protein